MVRILGERGKLRWGDLIPVSALLSIASEFSQISDGILQDLHSLRSAVCGLSWLTDFRCRALINIYLLHGRLNIPSEANKLRRSYLGLVFSLILYRSLSWRLCDLRVLVSWYNDTLVLADRLLNVFHGITDLIAFRCTMLGWKSVTWKLQLFEVDPGQHWVLHNDRCFILMIVIEGQEVTQTLFRLDFWCRRR